MDRVSRIFPTLLIATALFFSGCGGEENTQNNLVVVESFPGTPLVFTSNFSATQNGQDVEIDAPWFLLTLTGVNGSTDNLFIATMTIDITASDGSSGEWGLDLPNNVNIAAFAGPRDTTNNTGGEIVWLPNSATNTGVTALLIYVDGLPLTVNENLRYKVEVQLNGWFSLTQDDPNTLVDETIIPSEAFKKTITFRTKSG